MTTQSFEAITNGLSTKSEKIRALALAGYFRTDIARLLDIRYQHVRKVLESAGIKTGFKDKNPGLRQPTSIKSGPEKSPPTHVSVLLNGGFRLIAEWQQLQGSEIKLSEIVPVEPGVYAFGVDSYVRYVGLTHTGLRTRMGHYQRGHARQRTSARVKQLIAKALKDGQRVEVLIATPPHLEWNGFPVITAAGLEAGLIRLLQPEWNMIGVAQKKLMS